jgi:hypothetical protein
MLPAAVLAQTALMGFAATSAPAVNAPSFSSDLVPILRTRCAVCHLTGEEAGNMSLVPDAAYESLVGVKSPTTGLVRVVPGKPDDSYLIMKLEGTHLAKGGSGVRMPFGAEPLSADLLKLFRDWIAAGAPKN